MKAFEVTYADGHVAIIKAHCCRIHTWGIGFYFQTTRPSRAKAGDFVVDEDLIEMLHEASVRHIRVA